MNIITVSRQFGSGGRELGKRLADCLGYDYYDKEIIEALSREHGLNEESVKAILGSHGWHRIPLTYRNSFSHLMLDPSLHTQLLIRQREIIREIAQAKNSCVIVGRDADVILREYRPFRVFVCADADSRLRRCMAHERKLPAETQLTEKEIRKNIKKIDRKRIRTREILTGHAQSDHSTFDLTVNASGKDIKALSGALADFTLRWFEMEETC